MSKLNRFFNLPFIEKQYFFLAIYYSSISRFLTLFISFKKYSKKIGKQGIETSYEEIENEAFVLVVKKSINRIKNILPWRFACLEQAITAKKMLNRKNIPSTVYFGLSKSNNDLTAHAWVRVGNKFIAGASNIENFTVIAYFS